MTYPSIIIPKTHLNQTLYFQNLKRLFLCHYPLYFISWDPKYVTNEFQITFLQEVLNWAVQHHVLPPLKKYLVPFLKKYFQFIEDQGEVVVDELSQFFIELQLHSSLLVPSSLKKIEEEEEIREDIWKVTLRKCIHTQLKQENACFIELGEGYSKKTWWIHNELWVPVFEHSHLVHFGTTGLRTWPAALALLEYLYTHQLHLPSSAKIYELGAGAGVVSFFLAQLYPTCQFFITDIHPSVLSLLQFNASMQSNSFSSHLNPPSFSIQTLDFEQEKVPTCDLVICADVVSKLHS